MATLQLRTLLRRIEQMSGDARETYGTDGQLLEDFAARADEAAFAVLVARHAPLVMRVCRRVLHHEQDAEDAFQATFLVLARCCGSIRKREALADWLHGVAYRTAMKAKRSAARRRNHETQLRERAPGGGPSPTWDDVQSVLDEEIQRLPATFRAAFVQCVLEGKTFAAVAAELRCKEGTVASRVARARQRLQAQLARRGIKLAALLAALCVAEGVGKAAVPAALCQTVIRNGLVVAAGGSAAGTIPPHVAALATGVRKAMFLHNAKFAVLVLFAAGLFVAGAGALTHQALKAEEKPAVRPVVKPEAEPAKPAEASIEVAGVVLSPDGKPVAKARLYREHALKRTPENTADSEMLAVGTTDGEGRFRVKLPRPAGRSGDSLTLLAAADGFGLTWVELSRDEKSGDVTLRLVKDTGVRGRLITTEGKPVAGVTVQVISLVEPLADTLSAYELGGKTPRKANERRLLTPLNPVLRVTATDKDGRFEIAGLGTERAALVEVRNEQYVLSPAVVALREDFDPKKLANATRQGKPALLFGPTFECAVEASRPLEGTVREADGGKPVAGARVEVRVARQVYQTVTDAKGRYRIIGLPKADTYRVLVAPPDDAPFLTRALQVEDRPGLEPITFNVEMVRGVVVKGQVLDKASGKGVESQVTVAPLLDNQAAAKETAQNASLMLTDTDPEGRFRLVTLPGPNLLLAQVIARDHKIEGVPVNAYTTAVLDEADSKLVKPIQKGGLNVIPVAGGGVQVLENHNAAKVVDVKEDAAAVTCDVTVDRGKTLTVSLQDPDGKPLSGVMATGLSAFPAGVVTLKTAACPVVALDPAKPRKLAFLHAERNLTAVVTVRGDEKEPPTVKLAPAGVVTGRLLDGDGQPIAGADVYVLTLDGTDLIGRLMRSAPAQRSDKEGRFRVGGVFPDVKFAVIARKGQEGLGEEMKKMHDPVKASETLDLGDLRLKPFKQ
jgi:RNA polymerase sigma factor (sigma-70 family)